MYLYKNEFKVLLIKLSYIFHLLQMSFKNKGKNKCLSFLLYQLLTVKNNMDQDIKNYEAGTQ